MDKGWTSPPLDPETMCVTNVPTMTREEALNAAKDEFDAAYAAAFDAADDAANDAYNDAYNAANDAYNAAYNAAKAAYDTELIRIEQKFLQ